MIALQHAMASAIRTSPENGEGDSLVVGAAGLYKCHNLPGGNSRELADFSGFWTAIFRVFHDRFVGEGR
jgi:hypothetical protein